jgi:hypothetical protein
VGLSARDAISSGIKKAEAGRARRRSKFFSSPASPNKLIQLFSSECTKNDYGRLPPLSQKTRNMLNGFIRLGRNNNWTEERFYEIIVEIVEYWKILKTKDIRTLNLKKVTLGDRPSLLEFLIARDSILSAIEEIKKQKTVEAAPKKAVIKTKVVKHGPSEEDMEEAMSEQMEQYLGEF